MLTIADRTSSAPVIGIPTRSERLSSRVDALQGTYESYINALSEAGGAPLLIPPGPQMLFAAARCDGFLLAGGEDLAHSESWELKSAPCGPVDPARDAAEAEIVQFARLHSRPLLGICRGMQLVSCLLGGTVTAIDGTFECRHQRSDERRGDDARHHVHIAADSSLSAAIGALIIENVVSRHRVRVAAVGRELAAVAWSPDGVIEGLEAREWDFLGVQWHAEMTGRHGYPSPNLFRWLVERAAATLSVVLP